MHMKGICHRDLKPYDNIHILRENILLNEKNDIKKSPTFLHSELFFELDDWYEMKYEIEYKFKFN